MPTTPATIVVTAAYILRPFFFSHDRGVWQMRAINTESKNGTTIATDAFSAAIIIIKHTTENNDF